MNCLGYCVIGGALIGSMLLILMGKNGADDIQFKASLTEAQLSAYKNIYKQRAIIYLTGLVIGAVIAAVYIASSIYAKMPVNWCIPVALVLGVATLYYLAYPKETILKQLTSRRQVELYSYLNRAYSLRSVIGMILGILGTLVIGWGLSKQ